ncbi:Transmembrane protein 98 [Trichoplax sp. H2]|nr:Transmembrane protein 98 [Trichoplax sp. H2]|eukprot:RDD38618.1 Transmembrane protein 98 [Trichoplax sp. H2]
MSTSILPKGRFNGELKTKHVSSLDDPFYINSSINSPLTVPPSDDFTPGSYFRNSDDTNSHILPNSRQVDVYQPDFDDDELNDNGLCETSRVLTPICVKILKTCHDLTEKLVSTVMADVIQLRSREFVKDVVRLCKRVDGCVEDLVKIASGREDIRMLESKSDILNSAIRDLFKKIKSVFNEPDTLEWTKEYLEELDVLFENLKCAAANVAGNHILHDCDGCNSMQRCEIESTDVAGAAYAYKC